MIWLASTEERRNSMYKMVEVVGRSEAGYSEAVKEAVARVLESEQKVSWFQVMEHRGALKADNTVEFQAVLKVAVDMK
jgi:flavin-binding protein dodecin